MQKERSNGLDTALYKNYMRYIKTTFTFFYAPEKQHVSLYKSLGQLN